MFHNLPAELQALRQWICWSYREVDGRVTKVPYCPTTKQLASVTDPSTWTDFQTAVASATQFNGIGLVLTADDPYTIIDLDNKPDRPCTPEQLERHGKIYQAFDSYTELSVSGTGCHIIVRGSLPAGVHRDNVEVYSSLRYMVCTGNVVRPNPIRDYQPLLNILYQEMQSQAKRADLEQIDSDMTDAEIVDRASNAENGDKFNALCAGDMTGYPSQSEADLALLSIIAFYTPDNEQVRRIFRMTALGKRDKAVRNNTYLNFALSRIRGNEQAPTDLALMAANANALVNSLKADPIPEPIEAPQPETEEATPSPTPVAKPIGSIELPPGLIGELAKYFYSTAVRPVPEIALAAAIALTAGIAGRSYNISGSGLNQYIILLARTGSGKEGALAGIENLLAAVRTSIPIIDDYMGPATFASGQALVRILAKKPCFVSVLGEFGLTLQQLSDPRANSAEKMLKKVLLDIYGKSGWNRMLQASVYSDAEKNTEVVKSPNVTILGESTPETFFEGMDGSHIAEGLIPRFSIMEYTGPRPPRNRNAGVQPPKPLVQSFCNLAVSAITIQNNNTCQPIQTDPEALAMLDQFDITADRHINANNEVEAQLWNRAHLKALKLSGLLAVGINPHRPVVTADLARWAIKFVEADVNAILARFAKGDVGKGDSKQMNDLRTLIEYYFNHKTSETKSGGKYHELHKNGIVPYSHLMRRAIGIVSFKSDRMGATAAFKRTLDTMIASGMLQEIDKKQLSEKYHFTGVAYGVSGNW